MLNFSTLYGSNKKEQGIKKEDYILGNHILESLFNIRRELVLLNPDIKFDNFLVGMLNINIKKLIRFLERG